MKNDSHLFESTDPIVNGRTYAGLCGRDVPNAVAVYTWDTIEMGKIKMDSKGICRHCIEFLENAIATRQRYAVKAEKKYLYALLNGELAKQEASEAA